MLKNPEKTKNEIVQWIRDYFAENGPTCSAVVGVSGGKDSSVTAALCAEALGADRVVGVLMPNGARVANTCNLSEDYVGYSTKYGDAAGDFSPLANLLVHEVIQIGEVLGLPEFLIKKTPSDGLSGMSDEDKIGFTYATLDHYVLTGECPDEAIKAKIDRMHRLNLHKLQLMPSFKPAED